MSTISNISGTSSNYFTLNSKTTLFQSDSIPLTNMGKNGDVCFVSDGTIYTKKENDWHYIASDTNAVHKTGDETINGVKTFTSPINGTAMYAYWGDIAEYYESDNNYDCGTLVQFGGEKEITIASSYANAVITSEPGLIINSQLNTGQAIALCGRVPVKIVGKINKFDKITLSSLPGVACSTINDKNIIGIALEDKTEDEIKLVLCSVKMTF